MHHEHIKALGEIHNVREHYSTDMKQCVCPIFIDKLYVMIAIRLEWELDHVAVLRFV